LRLVELGKVGQLVLNEIGIMMALVPRPNELEQEQGLRK
jgi:hypothetical protein